MHLLYFNALEDNSIQLSDFDFLFNQFKSKTNDKTVLFRTAAWLLNKKCHLMFARGMDKLDVIQKAEKEMFILDDVGDE